MAARSLPCALACALSLSVFASPVRADDAPTLVLIVDGPGADAFSAKLAKAAPSGFEVSERKAKSVPCKLAAAKGAQPKAQKALDECLRKRVDADAVVLVVIEKPKKGKVVDVRVVLRAGAPTTQRVEQKGGALDDTFASGVMHAAEPTLTPLAKPKAATAPPTVPTSEDATKAAPSHASSGDAKDGRDGKDVEPPAVAREPPPDLDAPRVSVAIGPGLGARSFAYDDGAGPTIRPYSLGGAFLVGVAAEAYPGDDGEGVRFRPGVAFGYVTSSGLSSGTDTGRSIGSTWTRLDVGLRGRLVLGAKAPSFALGLGWSREAFVFTEADVSLPAAVTSTWRASLDARVPLGPVALLGGFAAMPAFRLAGSSDPYKHRSSLGLEGILGLAVPLARNLEIRLLATHTRYSTKLRASPATTSGATGTTDSYSRLQVLFAFLY